MSILWLIAGVLVSAWVILRLVFALPDRPPDPAPAPPADTPDSRIGRAIGGLEAAHPGLSGIQLLADSRGSYAARVKLIRAADVCLDVQYYIWRDDVSGRLLLDELRQAADRGVAVRLLLDDNGIDDLDDELAALNMHANVEVRLFNPFTIRRPKALGYLLDFFRLNRRMHNKSLTADNQMTIIGGRNIGDMYFGAGDQPEFADLNVLAIGAIVPELAADFSRYWTSASSYPSEMILPAAATGALERLASDAQTLLRADVLAQDYTTAIDEMSYAAPLTHGSLEYEWVPVTMLSDDPAKALGRQPKIRTPLGRIGEIIGQSEEQMGLVSAYFVPSREGTDMFVAMAARGVQLDVLTNALASTDVAVVHAGYARYRRRLLKAGVRLWEMKGENTAFPAKRSGVLGSLPKSSRTSLHAKTFTCDGARLFVGSFNFDPRSMHLNTELGFLMESPALAQRLQQIFGDPLRERAYEVRLGADGTMIWLEAGENGPVVHRHDPETSLWRRMQVVLWQLMPIEWLL